MPLETGTYISDLNVSNPAGTDTLDKADDHLRLIKSTVKSTFPNITGAVTPTHTDLNKLTAAGSPQFTSIELGAVSDTTITRSAAGVIAVEGGVVPLENRVNTFTASQFLKSNSDYSPQLQLEHAGATAGSAAYIILNRDRGTYSAPTIVNSGDNAGNLVWQGYDGSTYRSLASITAFVDGTPGASDMPGRITFNTTPDGSTTSFERMRIDSTGNVGIGGTPSGKLDVQGNSALVSVRPLVNTSYSDIGAARDDYFSGPSYSGAFLRQYGASAAGTTGGISNANFGHLIFQNNAGGFIYTNGGAPLVFGTIAAERFRITNAGDVTVTGPGGLGYGTGSGGQVTQTTSKGTAVTLNKTNGRIITDAAALAAGASVSFLVNTTALAGMDNVIATPVNGAYRCATYINGAGSFGVVLTNTTAGSLSEAVWINFAIIKSVTS